MACLLLCTAACTTQGKPNPSAAGNQGLSREEARAAEAAIWEAYRNSETAAALEAQLTAKVLNHNDDQMPITVELFWDEDKPMPDTGYPVYISLHGGGAFPIAENDAQWAIQQARYPAVQGIYICPRSARDTWDHWHETHMFALIDNLVSALMLDDNVDPNRIYLTGYCSGGNGVYQLAPIMADHFAAVSATKAISEGAPLDNLRNCPIDVQWGEADPDPIGRPALNRKMVEILYDLHNADRAGYTFRDIEHWRQGRFVNDKSTTTWISRFTRNSEPDCVVWVQDGEQRESSNPIRQQFYYLALDDTYQRDGERDRATARLNHEANAVAIEVTGYDHIILRLNDAMLDLDQSVTVELNGQVVFQGIVQRDLQVMQRTLEERGDRAYIYDAELRFDVP